MKTRLTPISAMLAALALMGAFMTGCADRVADCKAACEASNKCPGVDVDDCSYCDTQVKVIEEIGCGGKFDDASNACTGGSDACTKQESTECKSASTALNACINAVCDKDPAKCATK